MPEAPIAVGFEKRNVLETELNGAFCVVTRVFDGVFPHAEEVVKYYQRKVANRAIQFVCSRGIADVGQQFRDVSFNWQLFDGRGIIPLPALEHLSKAGQQPVGCVYFGRVDAMDQGYCRANGHKRAMDCASRDLLLSAIASASDSCGKSGEEADSLDIRGLL